MLSVLVRAALALVLVASVALKVASPHVSQAALATFGLHPDGVRWGVWGATAAAELCLAVGVALGYASAAYAAAALLTAFAFLLGVALLRGKAGAPCACFGSRSRVSESAVARNLLLAAGFAAVPSLPVVELTTEQWLGLGLAVALAGLAGLAVALLALAREVGMLRVRLAPQSALEIPEEGPPLGKVSAFLLERFELPPGTEFALAVFTSDGCRVCREIGPGLAVFEHDPVVAVRVFEEQAEAELWRTLEIPGSPYAVALGVDGVVRAKGAFNTLGQLESVLGSAERRMPELIGA